jgi:hypothetical protein
VFECARQISRRVLKQIADLFLWFGLFGPI